MHLSKNNKIKLGRLLHSLDIIDNNNKNANVQKKINLNKETSNKSCQLNEFWEL